MPAKVDPEVIAFMKQVMLAIGVATPSELADLLVREGLLKFSEGRRVFKWAKGESAPNHKATLMLLRRAGLLALPPN